MPARRRRLQERGQDRLKLFLQAFAAIASASVRPPVLPLGSLFGFGVLIPIRHGMDFLDARMVLAYAFLPMLFVASPVALGLPSARQNPRRLYAWLAAAVFFGWCIGFLFLTTAIATVNIEYRPTPLQLPEGGLLRTFAFFSLASVWFICAAAAWLGLLFSPSASRAILRVGFVALLAMFYLGPRALPLEWQLAMGEWNAREAASAVAAVLSLAALGLTNALRHGAGSKV